MLGNLSGSVSQRWNWADALWAQCNGGSSFLACSLMCHSFRSQRSLQHHTALRTVLLSVDNAHREPPHGHWGKYLCTYWGGTKNSHWDLDCGTFLKKKKKSMFFLSSYQTPCLIIAVKLMFVTKALSRKQQKRAVFYPLKQHRSVGSYHD